MVADGFTGVLDDQTAPANGKTAVPDEQLAAAKRVTSVQDGSFAGANGVTGVADGYIDVFDGGYSAKPMAHLCQLVFFSN